MSTDSGSAPVGTTSGEREMWAMRNAVAEVGNAVKAKRLEARGLDREALALEHHLWDLQRALEKLEEAIARKAATND